MFSLKGKFFLLKKIFFQVLTFANPEFFISSTESRVGTAAVIIINCFQSYLQHICQPCINRLMVHAYTCRGAAEPVEETSLCSTSSASAVRSPELNLYDGKTKGDNDSLGSWMRFPGDSQCLSGGSKAYFEWRGSQKIQSSSYKTDVERWRVCVCVVTRQETKYCGGNLSARKLWELFTIIFRFKSIKKIRVK